MVLFDDVRNQLIRRKLRRICLQRDSVDEFAFKLFDDGINRYFFLLAGLAQRASALTAEINVESLKKTRATGPLGNKLADSAIDQWGSGG